MTAETRFRVPCACPHPSPLQATDPKILEVKKRVRDVRRKLKRESKVQLSDEIIFFDDIAGNKQAKVPHGTCTGTSLCTAIGLALAL